MVRLFIFQGPVACYKLFFLKVYGSLLLLTWCDLSCDFPNVNFQKLHSVFFHCQNLQYNEDGESYGQASGLLDCILDLLQSLFLFWFPFKLEAFVSLVIWV